MGIRSVEIVDGFAHLVDERLTQRLLDQDVVRRHARLAGVQPLAPRDAPSGDLQVRARVDDDRTLATQFEGDRCEVVRGGRHHDAAHGSVARVEDVIETLRQQIGGFGNATFDERHGRGVHVLGNQSSQHRRRCGRHFARLHHHRVAGSDGAGGRHQQQLNGVVPRRDHQHDTQGLGHENRLGGHGDDRCGNALRLVPLLQVFEHQLDLAGDEGDVGDEPFDGRLAEIGLERGQEVGLVLLEHADHLLELLLAPGEGAGVARVVGGAEGVGDVGHPLS